MEDLFEKLKEPKSDKKQKAVALKYDLQNDKAPKVVAKGQGDIAAQIIKIAKESGVEIRKDANLVEILHALQLDEFIPLEAYNAVAEILRFVYNKKK
jgi:flagellar biosynthesis protein